MKLSYREYRILVMAVHDAGERLKHGCTFAERNCGNDILDLAHKVDEFLSRSEKYHEFIVTRQEIDDEGSGKDSKSNGAVHSEGECGTGDEPDAVIPALAVPVVSATTE